MSTLKIQFKPMILIGLTCLVSLLLGSSPSDEDRRQLVMALNHSFKENITEKEFDFIACITASLSN